MTARRDRPHWPFYDGRDRDHTTVTCPDCGQPADPLSRDHGGQCVAAISSAPRRDGEAGR